MGQAGQGAKTAVDMVLAQMEQAGEPEQIDLEDLLGLPRPVAGAPATDAPRGPGRPPGSRNRRTVQWAEFLLSRYASPLEVLAQMTVASVAELKAQLGCSALEAYQEKRHAAVALAPFLHQRQPLALNLTERKVVYLTIQHETGPIGQDPDSVTLEARVVRDQGLSIESPADVAHPDVAHNAQATDAKG